MHGRLIEVPIGALMYLRMSPNSRTSPAHLRTASCMAYPPHMLRQLQGQDQVPCIGPSSLLHALHRLQGWDQVPYVSPSSLLHALSRSTFMHPSSLQRCPCMSPSADVAFVHLTSDRTPFGPHLHTHLTSDRTPLAVHL